MGYFLYALDGFFFAVCVWCIRIIFANDEASVQRHRLIEAMASQIGSGDFESYLRQYEKVSYEKHLWAVALFQDWRKLYDESLIRLYDAKQPQKTLH